MRQVVLSLVLLFSFSVPAISLGFPSVARAQEMPTPNADEYPFKESEFIERANLIKGLGDLCKRDLDAAHALITSDGVAMLPDVEQKAAEIDAKAKTGVNYCYKAYWQGMMFRIEVNRRGVDRTLQ